MRKYTIKNGARMVMGPRGLEVENPAEPVGDREKIEERPSKHLERIKLEAEWNYDRGHRLTQVWKKRYHA